MGEWTEGPFARIRNAEGRSAGICITEGPSAGIRNAEGPSAGICNAEGFSASVMLIPAEKPSANEKSADQPSESAIPANPLRVTVTGGRCPAFQRRIRFVPCDTYLTEEWNGGVAPTYF